MDPLHLLEMAAFILINKNKFEEIEDEISKSNNAEVVI